MAEDLKEKHMKQAADFIRWAEDFREKIYHPDLRNLLEKLIRDLKNLRDTEYYFESGEKQLISLYERYLPYLKVILNEYRSMQETNDYEKIQTLSVRLRRMLENVDEAVKEINEKLPQDEIDNARAEAQARKIKQMLEEKTGRRKLIPAVFLLLYRFNMKIVIFERIKLFFRTDNTDHAILHGFAQGVGFFLQPDAVCFKHLFPHVSAVVIADAGEPAQIADADPGTRA